MNTAPRHIVERQIVEFRILGDGGDSETRRAARLQESVGVAVNDRLLPAMDEVLTSFAGLETTVRLDRIELQLGSIEEAELGDELVARACEKLAEALRGAISGILEGSSSPVRGSIVPARESRLAALQHFLQTGSLPWWKSRGSPGGLAEEWLAVLQESPADLVAMLRRIVSRRVVVRLVAQLPAESLRTLVGLLAGRESEALEMVISALALEPAFAGGRTPGSDAVCAVRARAIEYLLRVRGESAARDWSRVELREVAAAGGEPARTAAERIAGQVGIALETAGRGEASPEANAPSRDVGAIAEAVAPSELSPATAAVPGRAGWSEAPEVPPVVGESQSESAEPKRAPHAPAQETRRVLTRPAGKPMPEGPEGLPRPLPSEVSARSLDSAPVFRGGEQISPDLVREAPPIPHISLPSQRVALEEGEALTIENAGLVLLWPYLGRFFRNLGLTDGEAFASEAARERAVLLLAHTTTAGDEWPEHELLLDKLLCGWPLEEPIPRRIELTRSEVEESEGLLEAVISNWAVLGKTSVAGFREAFLVREGRLSLADGGWQLRVDRAGRDVLLDSLPWGIGLVLLSWMEQPLFVEW